MQKARFIFLKRMLGQDMNNRFGKSLNKHFNSFNTELRRNLELKTREYLSEFVILELHDGIYLPLKNNSRLINEPLQKDINIMENPIDVQVNELVNQMKALINSGSKESELQNKLIELEKLKNSKCTIYKEVFIEKPEHKNGRIDILLKPLGEENNGTILELKRSSFKLISRKRNSRVTRRLTKAIEQIKEYGVSEIKSSKIDNIVNILSFKLKIIIGQRMKLPGDYLGIIEIESNNPNLQIYTWDAWIAEFERMYL